MNIDAIRGGDLVDAAEGTPLLWIGVRELGGEGDVFLPIGSHRRSRVRKSKAPMLRCSSLVAR